MNMVGCDLCDLMFYTTHDEIKSVMLINGSQMDKSLDYSNLTNPIIIRLNVCKRCSSKHENIGDALNKKKEDVNKNYKQITSFKNSKNMAYQLYYLDFTRKFGKIENSIKL